jgi:hypothetical protein
MNNAFVNDVVKLGLRGIEKGNKGQCGFDLICDLGRGRSEMSKPSGGSFLRRHDGRFPEST